MRKTENEIVELSVEYAVAAVDFTQELKRVQHFEIAT